MSLFCTWFRFSRFYICLYWTVFIMFIVRSIDECWFSWMTGVISGHFINTHTRHGKSTNNRPRYDRAASQIRARDFFFRGAYFIYIIKTPDLRHRTLLERSINVCVFFSYALNTCKARPHSTDTIDKLNTFKITTVLAKYMFFDNVRSIVVLCADMWPR